MGLPHQLAQLQQRNVQLEVGDDNLLASKPCSNKQVSKMFLIGTCVVGECLLEWGPRHRSHLHRFQLPLHLLQDRHRREQMPLEMLRGPTSTPNELILLLALQCQRKSEKETAMDVASALAIIVDEARGVLDVIEIQSVLAHPRTNVLEVTTVGILSEIGTHLDRQREI
jgi:hypothetical protein